MPVAAPVLAVCQDEQERRDRMKRMLHIVKKAGRFLPVRIALRNHVVYNKDNGNERQTQVR